MESFIVDVAVIGAGTAGLAAYRAAIAAGKRAVILESGPYGTTCARVGCMPSKLLIAAAEAAHGPARWAEFGLRLDGRVEVDGPAVMARVKRERDRFVDFVVQGVDRIPENDRIVGHARFVDDTTLAIGDSVRIRFTSAVIATGSVPTIAPVLHGAGSRLIVNDDVFHWDTLPASVAVFGPGVIGLELGQALHRLGVKTHMFGRGGSVGPFSDPDLTRYAERTFSAEFPLDADADVRSVEMTSDGVEILFVDKAGTGQSITVDYVLAATGRRPNVANLGLENTSIERDGRGVPRFDRFTLQCGSHPIFIAGDANNDVPLLHEAADEGRIAGENAARFPAVAPGRRRVPLAAVFSDPQLGVIGRRYADLDHANTVIGEASFEDQGRSRVMLRNRGLLHVYADATSGRVLGAELIGPDAEHLAHLLAWGIQCELTVDGMLAMPFYHPVVEEGLRTALRDAAVKRAAWKPAPRQAAA